MRAAKPKKRMHPRPWRRPTSPRSLAQDGPLAERLPEYELRPSQLDMAEAIKRSLLQQAHAIIEAPTGTGKSIAYLVPALLSGKTVVVATANKSLQSQLYHKDIPFLAEVLGRKINAVVVKGRSNFVCNHKWEQENVEQERFALIDGRVDDETRQLRQWLGETQTGDVDELPFLLKGDLRARTVSFTDDCLQRDCRHFEDNCWINFMRDRAANAEILITNHHLLLNALELGWAGERILPPRCRLHHRRGARPGANRHRRLRDERHRLHRRGAAQARRHRGARQRRGAG